MKVPNIVKARLMDIHSDEYREITQDAYYTWTRGHMDWPQGILTEHNNQADFGSLSPGPLFWDIPAKYGTDRYLMGWIEEDDSGEVAESPA